MNTFNLNQINDFVSSKEGQEKIENLKLKMSGRINSNVISDLINDAYISLIEKLEAEGGEIKTQKTISSFVLSYFNVVIMRQNTLEYRHQNRQRAKVFEQEYSEESGADAFFSGDLVAEQDIESEIDVKLKVEAMKKILDDQDFMILKELVYLGRSTNALANEYGISPYLMSQRINEIYQKVEKYLD